MLSAALDVGDEIEMKLKGISKKYLRQVGCCKLPAEQLSPPSVQLHPVPAPIPALDPVAPPCWEEEGAGRSGSSHSMLAMLSRAVVE